MADEKEPPHSPSNQHGEWTSTPRPDPTEATTDQLRREVGSTRELLDTKIEALRNNLNKLAQDLLLGLEHGRVLRDEKFHALQMRIDDMERRGEKSVDESSRYMDAQIALLTKVNEVSERNSKEAIEKAFAASEKAVVSALASAEKAVGEQNRAFITATAKSEASTSKQLDAIDAIINATVKALNDKIDDIKGRLTTIEGSGKGSKDLMAIIFTISGIAIAAIAAFIAFSKAG